MKAVIVAEPQDRRNPPGAQQLTPEQLRARRRRNIAIGITVALLAALFYIVTIAKLGPGVLNRPL